MANDIPTTHLTRAQFDAIELVDVPTDGTPVHEAVKIEIVEKRSFLKDVTKGFAGTLVTVAKTVWHVPAAQGYLATLVVRLGVPTGAVAVITALVDAVLK